MELVTVSEMAQIEEGSGLKGVPASQLMENAGFSIAQTVIDITGRISGKKVIVLVGPGNNGGDGLVAARHLARRRARVFLVMPVKNPRNEANLQLAVEAGARLVEGFPDLEKHAADADICLDGFFGTGHSRPIDGDFKNALKTVNSRKTNSVPLLAVAIDVPSGVNADTGSVDPEAFIADHTLTLGYPKIGLFNCDSAIPVTGEIAVLDIGIPANVAVPAGKELIDSKKASRFLPRRPLNAHKGTSGKLVIFTGSDKYPGAAFLSSAGAVRSGAGLVTLATPRSLQGAIASLLPEITYIPLDESRPGIIAGQAAENATRTMEEYSALLAGCGLGQTQEVEEAFHLFVSKAKKANLPMVLDADGLNILAANSEWFNNLPSGCILTPHPGEMGRLCQMSVAEVQSDRIGVASRKAREWNQIVVLKGAYTVIARPCGQVMVNPCPNPALASAGTGDVLAGIIAGLRVQGLGGFDAAWLGVYIHSQAGIAVSREHGVIGVLASDLLPALPSVIKSLARNQ